MSLHEGNKAWAALRCSCTSPSLRFARSFSNTRLEDKALHSQNLSQLLSRVEQHLGVTQPEDWYQITRDQVWKTPGGYALLGSRRSLRATLEKAYPEYVWDRERFADNESTPTGYWTQKNNLDAEIERAERLLGIKQPEDWTTVTLADLRHLGISKRVNKAKLAEVLQERYPLHKWEKVLSKGRYSQQRVLENIVISLFPGQEVKRNVKKEAGLINALTGEYLELDVFLPGASLAFEYQEPHHYTSAWYAPSPLADIQGRDVMKRELAKSKGITLITVPPWWDGSTDSLAATIKAARPDLLQSTRVPSTTNPIPADMPPNYLSSTEDFIEDIGPPVTPCFFTLSDVNPEKWWIFEKYDGVRAFWNPKKKTFYSRHGKKFSFPQKVIDAMPCNLFLDGELWFGRESFLEASKISNRSDSTQVDWPRFKYIVFDIPTHRGTYAERYKELEDQLGEGKWKYIEVAPKQECTGMEHLERRFQEILDFGGEGIILRDPQAPWQTGRSQGYLKHKKYRDAEARIVRSIGHHQWECELPNGVRFVAAGGTSEFAKKTLMEGDIVSFKHRGYLAASKKPKFPSLYRVRLDLTWEDVSNNWEMKATFSSAKPIRTTRERRFEKHYWKDRENRKEFLLKIAAELNFDPLKIENWRTGTLATILQHKGVGLINRYGSIQRAVTMTFPEIARDPKHKRVLALQLNQKRAKGYWYHPDNLKQFFSDFAREMRFDPSNQEEWRRVTKRQICAYQGAGIFYCHGSLRKALELAFPEFAGSTPPTKT